MNVISLSQSCLIKGKQGYLKYKKRECLIHLHRGGYSPMNNRNVTIYISEGCVKCADLLAQMNKWNISYHVKNISKSSEYLEELQKMGIYGTPATFIEGEHKAVLGFQKNKIMHALGLGMNDFSETHYYSEGNRN